MLCPHCDGPTKVVLTIPANKRTDKRHYRKRECRSCGKGLITLELPAIELRELEQAANNRTLSENVGAPLPTRNGDVDLLDIESELETLLRPSLDAISEVLTSNKAVSRYRVDTARWLVADRREYRRTLAEQHGAQESDDPSIRELAKVLALVPDPMTGTDDE
jgi:hypothetical protein